MDSQKTLEYYNTNADAFSAGTLNVNFKSTQDAFLKYMKPGASILDFGCGAGRDTKYFIEQGYAVEATDGSKELCKRASEYTGIQVKQLLFQDLNEIDRYDGIWACSSILHLAKPELLMVLNRMIEALKENGYIYTSFKHGDFEGIRNGRYFTDFTLEGFKAYIQNEPLEIVEYWITGDVRPGREEEKWLNLILKRINS